MHPRWLRDSIGWPTAGISRCSGSVVGWLPASKASRYGVAGTTLSSPSLGFGSETPKSSSASTAGADSSMPLEQFKKGGDEIVELGLPNSRC